MSEGPSFKPGKGPAGGAAAAWQAGSPARFGLGVLLITAKCAYLYVIVTGDMLTLHDYW